jgi:F0F1-type ATP synthase membrane subunit b/b'
MIVILCLLGAAVVFLAIVVAFLYFQIVKPMQEQLAGRPTAIPSDEVEAVSKRADELALVSKTNHLDLREDIVRLNRRVEQLEIDVSERPTYEVKV